MPRALVSLGSNLGERRAQLDGAVAELRRQQGITVLAVSRWHETAPVGGPAGQFLFLNGALTLETSLSPGALLEALLAIEARLGRQRGEVRWAARPLDLDLLLYDELEIQESNLVVPHPRMAFRRFVLTPAAEVAADWRHPAIGWTVGELLTHLDRATPYVALAGPIGVGKSWLALELATRCCAPLIDEPLPVDRLQAFYADPAGRAWGMELQFLRCRQDFLSREGWLFSDLAISDFWFDQSLAFASVWLNEKELPRYTELWQRARQQVMPPKLTILLDAPEEVLLARIAERGRVFECGLTAEVLARLRDALVVRLRLAGQGPWLKIAADDPQAALEEAHAAILAME